MKSSLSSHWERKYLIPIIFVALFAIVGAVLLLISHAATPYASIEASSGCPSSSTTYTCTTDTNTSSGQYVQFGTASGGGTGGGGGGSGNGTGIPPSNVGMPTVPSGWHTVFSSTFSTPETFGSVGSSGPPGWYGPYSTGTGDTAQRRGQGSGEWVNSETLTVGPNASGDGYQVPANVLDVWQHIQNGMPVSGLIIPDCTGTATNGCTTTAYNQNQGLTSECVSFEYRVVPKPASGYKMVPLLWDDPGQGTGNEEVDSPENEFTNNTVTLALHFPTWPSNDTSYIDPNFSIANGQYSYNLNWTSQTPSNIDLTQWTEWETCRTPGKLQVWIDGLLAYTGTDGQAFTQWGNQPGIVEVPETSMHWVLQTETTTNGAQYQPTGNSADHVEFNWVQITAPN